MGRSRSKRRNESGAALVEMAIATPLLLMMLLGVITFGITNHNDISIESAAREASRFGATYPVQDAGTTIDWLQDVAQTAEDAASGALDTTVDGRVICVAMGSGDDSSAFSRLQVTGTTAISSGAEEADWCFTNTAPSEDTVVQVRVARDGWIEAFLWSITPTLSAEATNRYERG